MDEEKKEEAPKKIEVITGDGDLDISPVREDRTIFIPEVKKETNGEEN